MSFDVEQDWETSEEKIARLKREIQIEEEEAKKHEAKRLEERRDELRRQNEKSRNPYPYDDRF